MESLKKQRAIVKGSMTKLLTFVRGNLDGVILDEIYVKQERAKNLLAEFQNIETKMLDIDSEIASDLSEFEDNYYSVLAGLNCVIRKQSLVTPKLSNTSSILNSTQQQFIEVRLSKINIPTFDGDYMEWQSFYDIYCSTIHERDNLTSAQKFQYLRGLLKGEAAVLIRHLPVTDATYHEAFQKLIKRYDRKRHTVNAFIKTYMEHPTIVQPNAVNIRRLTDTLDESVRGLKALGGNAEKRDPWLVYIALTKLDGETRSLWAQETTEKEFPTFEDLLAFLGKRLDMIESLKGYEKKVLPNRTPITRTCAIKAFTERLYPICQKIGHRIYECDIYQGMTLEQRSNAIQTNNKCFNCLNGSHRVYECKSRARCQRCHRKHHTSLHKSSNEEETSQKNYSTEAQVHESIILKSEGEHNEEAIETRAYNVKPVASQTILPTALIKVQDAYGKFHTYRALLDSASQASFISEACVQELRIGRTNSRILVKGLGETTKGVTHLNISSIDRKTTLQTQALIIPKVSEVYNKHNLSDEDTQILKTIQLADASFCKRSAIDILLGVDMFFKILESDTLNLPSSLTAVRTVFGWVVAGKNIRNISNTPAIENFNILLDIDANLRRFWEVEEVPIITRRTPEEKKCEALFQSTTRHAEDSRFVVKLPFKEPKAMVGTSYNTALNRLQSMEKKFERNKEFGDLYKAFMTEYEQLRHMQRVSCFKNKPHQQYYLPHHGVLKANSTTTKLRMVFDASTKSSTGLSLNNILMVGPTVQPPLIDILIRFRQHKFVVCGDIEKMYRQVWVDEKDRKFQNILWRSSTQQQPTTYQLKTLTYGTASAAFLATRCLKEVGDKIQPMEPEASRAILCDTYVDDLMTETNSIAQTKALITQIRGALGNNGFNLRKFLSNSEELRSFLKNETEFKVKKIGENTDAPKVLGLQWDPCDYMFKFNTQLPERGTHSKRTLLSDASRNFDPIGWLAPIIIRVKILFQGLWMQGISWDDELPGNILIQWLRLRTDLNKTFQVHIPRWLQTSDQIWLIGFSDASELAYGEVVYALVETSEGIKSTIIAAKSRVAPVKQISLPKLELMGALLLTKLLKVVENSLTLSITKTLLFHQHKYLQKH